MMICPIPGLLEQETFSNISAYFLGAILSGDESYRLYGSKKKVWLAVVKHNIGYCTQDQRRHLHALYYYGCQSSGNSVFQKAAFRQKLVYAQ